MPLDANIILQGKAPQFQNPLEIAQQAMTMKQLAMQNAALEKKSTDESSMRDLLKRNTITGPDGKASLDKGGTISDLYKSNPEKALEYQKMFQSQDLETLKFQTTASKELAWSANQENWADTKAKAIQMGLRNADKLPDQFSPEFVQRWQIGTMSGEEQVKKMESDRDYKLKQQHSQNEIDTLSNTKLKTAAEIQKINAETSKTRAEASGRGGMTAGQKKLDEAYAKDYNDWTSGGAKAAASEISKIRDVIGSLKNKEVTTGGMTGMFPDQMTSNSVLKVRSDVQSTIMSSLRAIMGASFTEKEGERVIKNTWNESDSTENNIARLERLVGNLESQANDNNKKAELFGRSGSISKLANEPEKSQFSVNQSSADSVRMTDGKGGFFDVPKAQYGEAIASGLKKGG